MLTIAKLVIFLRFDTDGSFLQEFIWKQIVKLLDSQINITIFAKLENKEWGQHMYHRIYLTWSNDERWLK